MSRQKFGESGLWARYSATRVTPESSLDLAGFKSGSVNFKLALWDPAANGVRYLKSLIYHMGMSLSEDNMARLGRIKHRELGDPIAIRCRGELMCIDYLLAVHELDFLSPHVPLDGARVLEIGAGFGRSCHAMMSNHDIASYTIVDLDNTLALSRSYLSKVLTHDQLDRVRFVTLDEVEALFATAEFDLCVNIDSFAEMTEETVYSYLSAIDTTGAWFYCVQPVAKYLDPTLDNHSQGAELVDLALSTGLLRDVIDISDLEQISAQVPKLLEAYRPSTGWEPVDHTHHPAYPHYYQALYRKAG
ncbi:putative sugar O-methyltransferase [Tamaricihabitans halophyticus]|uniref:Putative sugar O-methyltransferase n=1 Tax=Tamaricihabitans halophyticus TaxID=1262583 RepID=A0A4R2QU06_9PSEU|nr:putative sugar O-methyltransferase [Tamaricihabitans halophyticus]TCP53442.1 putative sugar O-methyltransferase [Tamaricihabitans halophyticus]